MYERPEVERLDLDACADALAAGVEVQRRAAAERLALAAHFADLHGPGSAPNRYVRMMPGGSDGTPEVSEFAADALGPLIQQSTRSAAALLRDALDLRHRHPRLWEAVMTGGVDDWKARKVAQACEELTLEQAVWVDAVTVEAVIGLPFGRAIGVVEGKVLAADPSGHDAAAELASRSALVRAGRSDAAGLRMLHARTSAGDVARLDAILGHLADHLRRTGDDDDLQRRRAKALGLLANPALACVYLSGASARPSVDETGLVEVDPASPVAAARVLGEALGSLGAAALDRLRPRTVLYLHLAEEALTGVPESGSQVVRSEGFGPVSRRHLCDWLGTDQVVVKPVVDLHGQEPVDAYEIPLHLREAMVLAQPFDVFPFGTTGSRSRSVDADHTRPFVPPDDGGPPGQTRLDNLGPLSREHHRAKTFGGFSCYQPLPGLFLWRTPTGHWYRVDHTGTTSLGRNVPDIVRQVRARPSPRADWSVSEDRLGALLVRHAA